jgi:hypothetical protein
MVNQMAGFSGSTMDSREIATLSGKDHKNVCRDIRAMLEEMNIDGLKFESVYVGGNGEERKCYLLPKRECLILATGYHVQLRAKIIDRWADLESGNAVPIGVNPLTPIDIFHKDFGDHLKTINMIFGEVSSGVKIATAIETQVSTAQKTGVTIKLPAYVEQMQIDTQKVTFDEKTDTAFASKVAIGRNFITVSQIANDFLPLISTDINKLLVIMGYLVRTGRCTYSVTKSGREFASTRTLQSGRNKGSENVIGWNLDDIRFWGTFKEMLIIQRDLKNRKWEMKRK